VKRKTALLLGMLFLVLLGAADAAFVARADFFQREIDALLAEVFVSRTRADAFDLSLGGGVEIYGARLMRPDAPDRTYASVERIRVTPDWWSVSGLRPRVAEIEIKNPVLHVAWTPSGAFDMPSPLRRDLEPGAAPTTVELPRVTLKGLRFVFEDCPWLAASNRVVDLPHFNVTLEPERSERWLYRFAATLKNEAVGALDATGRFSADRFEMNLRRDGFTLGRELVGALKPELSQVLGDLSLDGGMTFAAAVDPSSAGDGTAVFRAHLDLDGVTATWARGPIVVEGLRGRVNYERSRLETQGLTASCEGGSLALHGYVDAAADPPVKIEGELAGVELTPAFGDRIARLPDPCPTIGEQIRQWDPRAFCDIVFALEQKRLPGGGRDLLRPKIDVEFRGDASIAFAGGIKEDGKRRGFNYRLNDVRGVLRCTDLGLTFDRLVATNGPLLVEARGAVGYEKEGDETYDIDVSARGLMLDDKVAEALSEDGRKLYDSLDAEGRADLAIAVKRAKDEPPGPRLTVQADLIGVRIRPREFPLDVDDVQGGVRIDDDLITIQGLSGRHRGAAVRLKGYLGQGARSSDFEFEAEADALPFEEPVFAALAAASPKVAGVLRELKPSGVATGRVKVGQRPGKPPDVDGYVSFERTSLTSPSPPFRITEASGAVGVDKGRVTIRPGTKAKFAGEPFAVEGSIGLDGALDFAIEGARVQITPRLLAELEPLAPALHDLGPEPPLLGPVEVKARIAGPAGAVKTSIESLLLRGVSLGIPGSKTRMIDVHAEASVAEDGAVEVSGFRGKIPWPSALGSTSGPALTATCGSFHWTPAPAGDGASTGAILMGPVAVENAPLGSWLVGLLPLAPETKARLTALGLSGALDVSAGTVVKDARGLTVARPSIALRDVAVGEKARVASMGLDRASIVIGADGLVDVQGDLVASGLVIFDVPATKLRARLRVDAVGVELKRISADLFGYAPAEPPAAPAPYGRLDDETSRALYGFTTDAFETDLRFVDVNVAAAVRAFGGKAAEIDGTFGVRLALGGTASSPESYVGAGSLQGIARKVVELPFFLKLFQQLDVTSLFQPADPPTRIRADFEITDRRIQSSNVMVDARDVVLKGSARVGFSGGLRADLDASYGIGLLPTTWLSHILSSAVAPGVVIDGTLSDPKVTVGPAKPGTPLPPQK
jgi:hypothetical protein